MPAATRPERRTARHEISNILAGKSADGLHPIPLKIPFTTNAEARLATAELIHNLFCRLHPVDDESRTPLIAKLLAHLNKTGLQTPDKIRAFAPQIVTIADAIRENPSLVSAPINIAGIIRAHTLATQQAAARLRSILPDDISPRTILWKQGSYTLEEATDPRHLQHDSAGLRHCVGTALNRETLDQAGLTAAHPHAIQDLYYWTKIRKGESRILTLTLHGDPVYTLEYDAKSRSISQIRGYRDKTPQPCERGFVPLCAALSAIRHALLLTAIQELPEIHHDQIITYRGIEPSAPEHIPDAIAGNITLSPSDHDNVRQAAFSNSLLTVDITRLSQDQLNTITHAASRLISTATKIWLPSDRYLLLDKGEISGGGNTRDPDTRERIAAHISL